jgi:hypothetical protein
MERRDALIMGTRSARELRDYLRRTHQQPIPEFDDFLSQVEVLFKLRVAAEDRYRAQPCVARSRRNSLPLDWREIDHIVNPTCTAPPEHLITRIARECLAEVEEILCDLRKVLIREREKMSLGMVQQVDAHCLRWLYRQPGHDAIEKAGAKQRILAIVRRENFNTLENRVFKDFLARCGHEAAHYLRKNRDKFQGHETIKCVRRLLHLCEKGAGAPLLEKVTAIGALPNPNYVLRQERRYAKIWKEYVELVRQGSIAERLWSRHDEVGNTLTTLRDEVPKHTNPNALYHCPIWFNALDGKQDLLDRPFYENETGTRRAIDNPDSSRDDAIIDLTGGTLRWDLLIYGQHENAAPYIQDYQKPSIEDLNGDDHHFLKDLMSKQDRSDGGRLGLGNYFTQLHARLDGKRWFILVPDTWDPLWQETIIKSVPLARHNVFLLWRSVAAVIGSADQLKNLRNNDTVVVLDFQSNGSIYLSKLTMALDETGAQLIPQRKSYNRHKEYYAEVPMSLHRRAERKEAFLWGIKDEYVPDDNALTRIRKFVGAARHVILANSNEFAVPFLRGIITGVADLEKGVKRFIEKQRRGQAAYYDEMEALSLIVQTADERVIATAVVEADEKFPGGREKRTEIIRDVARLKAGSDYVNLLLCMGEAKPEAALKIKRHLFKGCLSEDHAIHVRARMTPGQGMAIVTIESDFLREPIELDFLQGMADTDENNRRLTMAVLENEMERSFPPDSPDVVADYDLWINGNGFQDVKRNVERYMNHQIAPDGKWFAQATRLYPAYVPLPQGLNPLERLRRKNVFGNDPKRRLPLRPYNLFRNEFDFDALFRRLADDYNDPAQENVRDQIARLIAWTYQSDFAGFRPIRSQVLKRVLDYSQEIAPAPLKQEWSLCANLCKEPSEWRVCLEAIRLRISNSDNKVTNEFYLLYNLLQFNPTIIRDTGIADKCWEWMKHIPHWYEQYRYSPTIGYILKSILYFLRCRRFDGKIFLTRGRDAAKYDIINQCLQHPVHHQHEALRNLVIEYLNNRGTIDGLPVN